LTKTKETDISS